VKVTKESLRPLDEVLQFQLPPVISAFQSKTNFSRDESEKIFLELKRWLWACAKRTEDELSGKKVPTALIISPELKDIDEMWHCFLDRADEYKKFCDEYLGRIIEHHALSTSELEAFEKLCAADPDAALRQRQRELRPQLDYLYDLLGEQVLRNWYLS
jgi:hypothetical protein